MVGHLLDHFVFKSRRLKERTKWIVFGLYASAIFCTFWWFRGAAWGIDGPVKEHWGLLWRKVRLCFTAPFIARCVELGTDADLTDVEHLRQSQLEETKGRSPLSFIDIFGIMMDAQISRHPQPHSLELLSDRKCFLRCM